MGIKVWLDDVRTRLRPTAYVDYSEVPDGPVSPYRARITTPVESGANELDVREREIVRGEIKAIYEIRCPCGRRWFNPRLEKVQVCPRCGRAVLVMQPGLAAD
jgi:DNA-directed RNA polymerase subunit RPC12/RpoP